MNGGVISLSELCESLRKVRARTGQAISPEDVKRAIQKLHVLGGGYRVVVLGGQRFVLSVPSELSTDSTIVLQHCAGAGAAYTTAPLLCAALRWDGARAARALQSLLADGLTWLDQPPPSPGGGAGSEAPRYYFQALWTAPAEGAGGGAAVAATATGGGGAASPAERGAASGRGGGGVADGVLRDDTDD